MQQKSNLPTKGVIHSISTRRWRIYKKAGSHGQRRKIKNDVVRTSGDINGVFVSFGILQATRAIKRPETTEQHQRALKTYNIQKREGKWTRKNKSKKTGEREGVG